jgi:hypothetical protein
MVHRSRTWVTIFSLLLEEDVSGLHAVLVIVAGKQHLLHGFTSDRNLTLSTSYWTVKNTEHASCEEMILDNCRESVTLYVVN